MKVEETMTKAVVCVGVREPVEVAARLMARYNLGMLPVKNASGQLLGVVTDRDLAVRALAGKKNATVGQVMSSPVSFVQPGQSLEEAAQKMAKLRVRRLPVVQNGSLVGILSLADVAQSAGQNAAAGDLLGKICTGVCRIDEMK